MVLTKIKEKKKHPKQQMGSRENMLVILFVLYLNRVNNNLNKMQFTTKVKEPSWEKKCNLIHSNNAGV